MILASLFLKFAIVFNLTIPGSGEGDHALAPLVPKVYHRHQYETAWFFLSISLEDCSRKAIFN